VCQVAACRGFSGSNAEYVTRLADFLRQHVPLDDDRELFELDARVRRILSAADVDTGGYSSWQDRASAAAITAIASSSSSTSLPGAVVEHKCDISTHRDKRVAVLVVAG